MMKTIFDKWNILICICTIAALSLGQAACQEEEDNDSATDTDTDTDSDTDTDTDTDSDTDTNTDTDTDTGPVQENMCAEYPEGPYGFKVGDVIANYTMLDCDNVERHMCEFAEEGGKLIFMALTSTA